MRTKTAQWFETKVRYEKIMEDGMQKKVVEKYVIDAVTFGDAEKRIAEEMENYISGDFEVKDIKPAQYSEIFISDQAAEGMWYKVKIDIITIDEKSSKKKRNRIIYLVQGSSVESARKNVDEVLDSTMSDYVIKSIVETKIIDVFEYKEEGKDGNND